MSNLWGKIIGFFTGNAGGKVMEMADEAFHTEQEKAATDQKDTDSARADQGVSHNTFIDVLVDGWSRIVRPGFATWAFGELVGWWDVKVEQVSSEKMHLIILIVTFYFGGRVILKDIPSVLKALRGK